MRLVRLGLESFRPFRSAMVDFAAPGLTFLVGPNNAGKSALLLAIDRLVQPNADATDAHAGTTGATITSTFELDLTERGELVRIFSSEPKWLAGDTFRRVAWRFAQIPSNQYFTAELQLSVADGTLHPFVQKTGAPNSDRYRTANLSEWFTQGNPGQRFDLVHERGIGDSRFESVREPPLGALHDLLSEWRSRAYHLTPLRPGTDAARVFNLTPVLEPTGRNLAEVLAWTRLNAGPEFEQIATTMRELVPGIGDLQIPGEGQRVRIVFRDDRNHERNVTDMGTGVQQLLMAVYLGTHHPSGGLISLEEPESNLHPDAQRWLLRRFEGWAADRQIVASTHSTVFLDRAAESGARVWLVDRSDGVSTISETAPAGREVLDALGVRLSDVLNASLVILVEGESDRLVLEQWYRSELEAGRARVVASGGGDSAWDVDRWQAWVDAAGALPQRALFIRDRDELSDAKVRKLQGQAGVYVLKRRELENYLLEPTAIRQVLQRRLADTGLEGPGWTDRDLADRIARAADDRRPEVVCKRVVDRLGNATMVPRNELADLIAAGPTAAGLARLIRTRAGMSGSVAALWREETRRVSAVWPQRSFDLAPGSAVLEALFGETGLRYDKVRDAPALAELIERPRELTARLSIALIQAEAKSASHEQHGEA